MKLLTRNTLKSAGHRIANVLDIKTQIRVKATYHPFCPANASEGSVCSDRSKLGKANAASRFPATESNGRILMYPQALVKQAKIDVKPEFSEYDIIADFNSQANYYFKSQTKIKKDQTDFECIFEC